MFDWITGLIEQSGYVGIAFLMFLENVFPPIPSELIMPLAGFLVQTGQLNGVLVVIFGTIGSMAGTGLWYLLARLIARDRIERFIERYGRWLTLDVESLNNAEEKFNRHQKKSVFLGRMLPAIRTLISLPAGFARMPVATFLIWSTLGSLFWVSALTALGYVLGGQYERVQGWVNPVTNVILAGLAGIYIFRLVRGKGRNRTSDTAR